MNKIFHIGSTFKAYEENNDLHIAGMASTTDKDRVGDVIEASAWTKGGLDNYLNNPVILFNHDYDKPIGRAVSLGTNDKGLQLKAKIAKSAGHIGELIKEGVLGAFSVGFMVKDAEWDDETDGYRIKDAELLEVSVVTVPANQAATFSIAKSFESVSDYEEFKKTFKEGSSKDEPELNADKAKAQETKMSDDINKVVQQAVEAAVQKATAAMAMAEAERKAAAQKAADEAAKAAADAEAAKKSQEEVAIRVLGTGAERLMKEVEERFNARDAEHSKILEEMRADLAEKSAELMKIRDSKRVFADRGGSKNLEDFREEILDAHFYGIITKKGFDTKLGREVIQKVNTNAGVEVPAEFSGSWYETFVSTQIERDIELELVLDPYFRKVQMNAATMVVPTLPDAGYAQYVSGPVGAASLGSVHKGNLDSRDDAQVGSPYNGLDMSTVLLTASKIVSRSYLENEVEEDAIVPILPLIRAAMARSHARTIEQSILMGGHANAQVANAPDGLVQLAVEANGTSPSPYVLNWDATSPYDLTFSNSGSLAARLLDMRQAMGKYGKRPTDVTFVVSLACYYALLDDVDFQLANELGSVGTRVTGDIGSVYGTRVVVCDEFPAAADGRPFAVAFNPRNFVVPVLRGITVEEEYSAENQRRCLISTQRRGFKNLFANGGNGQVVTLTY